MPTAEFAISSLDPTLPRRLLGVDPRPSIARELHHAGVIVYQGSSAEGAAARQRHRFVIEFGTENAAGVLANHMFSALRGHVSALEIGGERIPVHNAAIKRALLVHAFDE